MRRLFTLSAVAVASGCSLFGFEGYTGGADPTGDGGGASDGAVTATSDATTDATTESPPNDAGPFCQARGADSAVCDDFEKPGTFTGLWPEQDEYLGTLEVQDGQGFGGGRGLRFTATPRPDGQVGKDARVVLGWTSPSAASFVDAEVAIRPRTIPAGLYSAAPLFVQLEGAPPSGRQAIGFYFNGERTLSVNPIVYGSDGSVLAGGGTKPIATLPPDAWSRVRIVADLTKAPGSLFVYVDGTQKHEQVLDGFTPAKVSVRIGANYAGGTDGGTVSWDLDDARIDWK